MDRREFLKLLGSGALMAMVAPSIAQAFQSGKMSEEELFALLQNGGEGIITQEAVVLRREGRGYVPTGDTVTHHYRVTGVAEEREYQTQIFDEADYIYVRDESGGIVKGDDDRPIYLGKVDATQSSIIRKRKFIPGHRVNADGSAFVNPHRVEAKIPDEAWDNPLPVDLWS